MTENERAAHATTQTFGLALVSAALLAVVLLSLIVFDGDDVGIFVVLSAVAVGATLVTWRFDRQWARASVS